MSRWQEEPLSERFWAKVRKSEGCWEWVASTMTKSGYGKIFDSGKLEGAHRVSWKLEHGEIPDGLCVLHHCDNRKCVRPSHLFLGTHKDNTDDMWSKNRGSRSGAGDKKAVGARHGMAKLSEAEAREVKALRLSGSPLKAIASKYGISDVTVSDIANGRRWKCLLEAA